MKPEVRKIATFVETLMIEGGKPAEQPITTVVVAAVLRNPWAGKGFCEDLRPEILRLAPVLGAELTSRLVALMPAERVEAYGKAAVVGVNGEIEHASALIHTLRFGNMFREAVHGTAFLSFTNTRVGPGAMLSLPMIHKSATGQRSHFLTATFQIADAPAPDEILIAIGAADGGRAHPRIGDRFIDMAEMDQEKAQA
ncbi:amino acid synthesis family protein [Burkholderia sp. Ac-20379]|uniref:amino acid synthesis family protein n=1 Tax=Burkholderia sp. Ac-20379 TaxID=2703900 RepID=UPI00198094B6|nr:amino acid synthesis family protein [Burkholderia sp. Ac-20379]MBN3726250.1 amino acid synthesis family protein [Burkholderia sp. Ac-20379]